MTHSRPVPFIPECSKDTLEWWTQIAPHSIRNFDDYKHMISTPQAQVALVLAQDQEFLVALRDLKLKSFSPVIGADLAWIFVVWTARTWSLKRTSRWWQRYPIEALYAIVNGVLLFAVIPAWGLGSPFVRVAEKLIKSFLMILWG